ncbi:MAG: hypothetical protein K2X77_00490 [Candidatus Obscuribacterales bacterium]|nr:hypothetical protein [Candidatus Obscuribacterales bacterium]
MIRREQVRKGLPKLRKLRNTQGLNGNGGNLIPPSALGQPPSAQGIPPSALGHPPSALGIPPSAL